MRFLREPEQQLSAGGMLAYEAGQRLLEQIKFTLLYQQPGKFLANFRRDHVQGTR